jgi:hypothetical protein
MKIVIMVKALSMGIMHDVSAIIKILSDCSFPKIRTIYTIKLESVCRLQGSNEVKVWPLPAEFGSIAQQ